MSLFRPSWAKQNVKLGQETQRRKRRGGNKFCFLTLPSKDDGLNRHVIDFRDWARLYDIDNALGPFDVAEIDFHEVVLPYQI